MKKGKRIAFYSICIILSSMILVKISSCSGNLNSSSSNSSSLKSSANPSENQSTDYSHSLSLSESVSSSSDAVTSSSSVSEEPLTLKRMTFKTNVNVDGIDLNYLQSLLNYSSSIENVTLATYTNEIDGTTYDYILNGISDSNGNKVISLSLNDQIIEYTTISSGSVQDWKIGFSNLSDLSFEYTKVEIKNSMYLNDLTCFTHSDLNSNINYNLAECDIADNQCYFKISLRFGCRLFLKFEIPLGFDPTIFKQSDFLISSFENNHISFDCLDDTVTNFTFIKLDNYGLTLNSNYDYYLKGIEQVSIDNASTNVNINYACNDLSTFKIHVK